MKKSYLAWMSWKNEDEIKSRILSENKVHLELIVHMNMTDFADLVYKLGREDFKITFEK